MEKRIISIDINPQMQEASPENAGVMWEHNATSLVFNIDSKYVGDYKYYLEYRSLIGTKVRTEYLELDTETNTVTYDIPVEMSSLRGVECFFNILKIDDDGQTQLVVKSKKFCLEFDYSPDTDNSIAKVNDFSVNALFEAIRLGKFKGDRGEKGDQGEKGDKGDRGEGVNTMVATGKNLIKTVIDNEAVSAKGGFSVNENFLRTDYIYLHKGTYIYSNSQGSYGSFRYALYQTDEDKTFDEYFSGADKIKIVIEDPRYIVLCDLSSRTELQLEMGEEATPYEAYYEKIKDSLLVDVYKKVEETEKIAQFAEEKATETQEKFELIFDVGKNLYDISAKSVGEYLSPSNIVNEVSGTEADGDYATSDWINVEENENYIISYTGTSFNFRIHFADLDGILVAMPFSATKGTAFSVPSGTKKLRFSNKLSVMEASDLQLEKGDQPTNFLPYRKFVKNYILENYNLLGKTAVFNGDSILELPYSWGKQLCDYYGMKFVNYAIGGSTLSVWGNEGDAPKDRHPLIERYKNMTDDADFVVISIGTNDWNNQWAPMGENLPLSLGTQDEENAKKTFKGSLHLLIRGLLDKYLGKPIIFCTPIKRCDNDNPQLNPVNSFDLTLMEYADAIKDVCGQYGIPVIDMFNECPLNPAIDSQQAMFFDGSKNAGTGYANLYNDRTHPNYYGAKIQARCAMNYFNSMFID